MQELDELEKYLEYIHNYVKGNKRFIIGGLLVVFLFEVSGIIGSIWPF